MSDPIENYVLTLQHPDGRAGNVLLAEDDLEHPPTARLLAKLNHLFYTVYTLEDK